MNLNRIVEHVGKVYQYEDKAAMYSLGFVNGVSLLGALILALDGKYTESVAIEAVIPITHHAFYRGSKIRQKRECKKEAIEHANVRI